MSDMCTDNHMSSYSSFSDKKPENKSMRYFDINVSYEDSDGYSIFIAVDGDEDTALKKAVTENRFEYEEDVNNIEYIDEITEEEYNEWK